jgi:hypothetical protein
MEESAAIQTKGVTVTVLYFASPLTGLLHIPETSRRRSNKLQKFNSKYRPDINSPEYIRGTYNALILRIFD